MFVTTYDSYMDEEIDLPVHVEKEKHRYAGFWMRFWAYLIDAFVISGVSGMLLSPLLFTNGGDPIPLSVWTVNGLLAGLIYHLYFILMTKYAGQTLGKMVLGIRVIQKNDEPLTWLDVIFREGIGRFIYNIMFGLKLLYLIIAFTSEKQGIHDMIGHTRVVHVTS